MENHLVTKKHTSHNVYSIAKPRVQSSELFDDF